MLNMLGTITITGKTSFSLGGGKVLFLPADVILKGESQMLNSDWNFFGSQLLSLHFAQESVSWSRRNQWTHALFLLKPKSSWKRWWKDAFS